MRRAPAGGSRSDRPGAARRTSLRSRSSRRRRDGFSSFVGVAELDEAARDPARDRAGRQLERIADRAVALVACEEAVEDLPAVLGQLPHRLVDRERLVERADALLVGEAVLERFGRALARARADRVDAEPARELREPGPQRLVVAEAVEVLPRPHEDVLEDVLRLGIGQPEALERDPVDIARVAFDKRGPRRLVALAAARDEITVGQVFGLHAVILAGRPA